MESLKVDGNAEREEGEIVDDDLEVISDDSIVATPRMGKLNSHKESLRALSLSSVSDVEVVESSQAPNLKTRKPRRKPAAICKKRRISKHHHHRHKRRSRSSSDSDDNVSTRKLLKEAIKIDSKGSLNNSLRTRLRGMVAKPTIDDIIEIESKNIQFDTLTEMISSPVHVVDMEIDPIEDSMCEEPDEKNGNCRSSPTEELDNELIQLRLEALKTAVMNKFQHRKKRKLNQELSPVPVNLETNKENSSDNVNTKNSTSEMDTVNNIEETNDTNDVVSNSVNNSEEEEDEDILRAVLLASIAKKITNKVSTPKLKPKVTHNMTNIVTAPKPTKIIKTEHTRPVLPKPKTDLISKISPFVISVNNSDSDSDDYTLREDLEQNDTKKIEVKNPDFQKTVENEVDKFLKQQRAEVEAKQKFPPKVSKPYVKPVTQTVKTKIAETNSLYKLLPKSKQLEYEKLIQKLKSAEKKPRVRRLSNRVDKNVTKIVRNRISSKTVASNVNSEGKTQLAGALQRTIRNMQTQVDGRLQIQGKYHVLSPLLKKLNEASAEQKKLGMHIKHLLNQLSEARNQYTESQQSYNILVKDLFKKKEEIDKRQPQPKENVISQPPVTSNRQFEGGGNKNKIFRKINSPTLIPQKTSTPIAPKPNLQCKIMVEKCPINITDPNDIEFKKLTDPNDIEFKKLDPKEAVALPKYTSPLDSKGSINKEINPLEILCPFEINGSCRDKECTFNHYNKNV